MAQCHTPSVPFLTLTYDPEGRLAAYTYNLATTEFLYDGVNLIGEYSHSGSGHSGDSMLHRYVHGSETDEPLIWYAGAAVSSPNYLVANYQGSIIGYTNSAGTLTELYKYGPYGEPINSAGAEFWGGSRFRYTGQYAVKEARLYYYKARVYDPFYGRFLQTDPIGSRDDMNLYAYVKGDPISAVDPTGLETFIRIRGREVSIETTVKFGGDANTAANRQAYVKSVEAAWTGKFGNYNVTTKITETDSTEDVINLNSSGGTYTNGNTIEFNVNDNNNSQGAFDQGLWDTNAAHEYGHLLGLRDRYRDKDLDSWWKAMTGQAGRKTLIEPGWNNNIMGKSRQPVDQRNIDEAVKSSENYKIWLP